VGDTVVAVAGVEGVDRVIVVDDGSRDGTANVAEAAGATVVRLPTNRGKGAAVKAGVAAAPDADVLLLIDADVGASAGSAGELLAPVLADEADLVVGVLPKGSTGGLGTIKRLAAAGIRRAAGVTVQAPLSGQRAVRAELLRDVPSVERFGLEVGMTIDAVRSGARLLEVPVPMTHRRTGRSVAGFVHRGRQGADIVRSMWPRLTSVRARIEAVVLLTLLLLGTLVWTGGGRVSAGIPAEQGVDRVVLVGVPHMALSDLGSGTMPTLDRLSVERASAATNVRTLSIRPSSSEAYATLGAGVRVAADRLNAGAAYPADAPYEGGQAASVAARRSGVLPTGDIVVPRATAMVRGAGGYVSSRPGALGQALADAGLLTAVVNNADSVSDDGSPVVYRPAAAAVVDAAGSVGAGTVTPSSLLVADPSEPYGLRANVGGYVSATVAALDNDASLVVADLGDMNRTAWQAPRATPPVNEAARTHIGQFASDVFGGGQGTALTTIERKWSTNMRVFGRTLWTWMVGIPEGMTEIALFPVASTKGTDFKRAPRHPARSITYFDRFGSTAERGPSDPLVFEDGLGAVAEADIAAPPTTVWALVTDLDLPAQFSAEFLGAAWDGDDRGVGAVFTGRNHHPAMGEWTVPCFVSVCDEAKSFGWTTSDPDDPGASWRFDLEPLAGTGTRLRFVYSLGPGPSGTTMVMTNNPGKEHRVVRRRVRDVRANMQRTVDGIKQLAEGEQSGPGKPDEPTER
jgi:hypothetical protein